MDRGLHEFLLMEYTALRAQLTQQYQTTFNWFIYVITADALIVSWISTTSSAQNTSTTIYYAAATMPLIISVLGHIMVATSYRSIRAAIEYLKVIDARYGDDIGFGQYYDNWTVATRLPSTRNALNLSFFLVEALSLLFLLIVIF